MEDKVDAGKSTQAQFCKCRNTFRGKVRRNRKGNTFKGKIKKNKKQKEEYRIVLQRLIKIPV